MISLIKKILLKFINDIDVGNCNMSDKEAEDLIKIILSYTDRTTRLSKYQACQYLNISRASFDNYVREGKLPRGKKVAGFKELSWQQKELDEYIKKYK